MPVDLSFENFLNEWKKQPDFWELTPTENRRRIELMYKKPEGNENKLLCGLVFGNYIASYFV
jgi:hypothetical protein